MDTFCIIGIILSISNILFILFRSNNIITNFKKTLNPSQLNKYKEITNQRLYVYILGSILGFIIAYIYIMYNKKTNYKLCKFIVILCIIKIVVYNINHKKQLMMYNLNNKRQVDLWADIYTNFKTSWIYSIFISILSYIFFYYGIINI